MQVMPWVGFRRRVLPTKELEIKIVDYLGFAWKGSFRIVEDNGELVCKIGGEWGVLYKARRLQPRHPLKLVVTQEEDNRTVYLRHVPLHRLQNDMMKSIDTIVCLDAAAAGFPVKGLSMCFFIWIPSLIVMHSGLYLNTEIVTAAGTSIRIADEFSLREMRMLNTYYVELESTTVGGFLCCMSFTMN